jgi:diaminohydroxyphosphoribosylaminopyrimidine deaminase/5-amino-6-(5-phosphoribosylamino)uracil reductase
MAPLYRHSPALRIYTEAMSEPSPWMTLALAEAALAGVVSPNPAVGCVIVSGGEVVGRGYTRPPGGAHAEVIALQQAGYRADGASAYVTLEPCSHWGRTPPCADALIEAGIAAVYCSLPDPDIRVRGKGITRLRRAGVAVTVGDGAGYARAQLAAFITHRVTGRPMVTAKFAVSLDGRIATRTGDSRWISAAETRAWTLRTRSEFDAILAGSGTILADDPQLTAREPDGSLCERQPVRVVLDRTGRTPPGARIFAGPSRTLVATTHHASAEWLAAIRAAGGEPVVLPESAEGVEAGAVLDELGRLGILTVLVEGGSVVHGTFFDRRLVDRVQAIVAPLVIGGRDAPAAVGGTGPDRLAGASRLLDVQVQQIGPDIVFCGALRPPPEISLDLELNQTSET